MCAGPLGGVAAINETLESAKHEYVWALYTCAHTKSIFYVCAKKLRLLQ